MSAIGPKRTSLVALHMSAFGGKADMTSYSTFGKSGQRAPHGSFMLYIKKGAADHSAAPRASASRP